MLNDNFAETLFNTDLLSQAVAVLEQQLASAPADCSVLEKLGELYRKQGELTKAGECYSRLSRLRPTDRRTAYLKALLQGEALPDWTAADPFQPAPFLLWKSYLANELHAKLLSFAVNAQPQFTQSRIAAGYQPEVSNSQVLYPDKELLQYLRQELRELVPALCAQLQIAPFTVGRIQLEIKAYGGGHYFRPHSDGLPDYPRQINFGCLFYCQPRAFTGGDFLLFDTDFRQDSYWTTRFTRIAPEDNCAIFYPSKYYHAVLPVRRQSTNFSASRFALVGHIEERVSDFAETGAGA